MGPILSPETSVQNQTTPRNITEDDRIQVNRSDSLRSRTIYSFMYLFIYFYYLFILLFIYYAFIIYLFIYFYYLFILFTINLRIIYFYLFISFTTYLLLFICLFY